jgi:thiamine biosynthesis lipoprotein
LANKTGKLKVTEDFVKMLEMSFELNEISQGKFNPAVGNTLSDLGYDKNYTLVPKNSIRSVPSLKQTVKIVTQSEIETTEPVLFDFGALGKGYFVDKVKKLFLEKGLKRFLVDGSGDMTYEGNGEAIRVGLEHPSDKSKVIGVLSMTHGALCGSGTNRRAWGDLHHTIDPYKLTSTKGIVATWVYSNSTALADGLATCLFLTEPEVLKVKYDFEYLIVNEDLKIKKSPGFLAELF